MTGTRNGFDDLGRLFGELEAELDTLGWGHRKR